MEAMVDNGCRATDDDDDNDTKQYVLTALRMTTSFRVLKPSTVVYGLQVSRGTHCFDL
jgi:hypothetical protein